MDSPLVGTSHLVGDLFASVLREWCWNNFLTSSAAMELSAMASNWESSSHDANRQVEMAQAKGTEVSTLGNRWDCIFNPLKCYVLLSNQWDTQVLGAASNSNGYYLWSFPRWLPPLFNLRRSHGLILSEAGPVADIAKIIGPQVGFSPRSR